MFFNNDHEEDEYDRNPFRGNYNDTYSEPDWDEVEKNRLREEVDKLREENEKLKKRLSVAEMILGDVLPEHNAREARKL